MTWFARGVCLLLMGVALAACGSAGDAPPLEAAASTPTDSLVTAVPTSTPTTPPTAAPSIEPPTVTPTFTPLPTDDRIPATLNPTVLTDISAPIRLRLPAGWQSASDALMLPAGEGMGVVPFSLYRGPVSGGTGTVLVLWAFENVVPASPVGGALSPINLFADGLRLLLFVVVEPECNLAYDDPMTFMVGGITGQGAYFAADDCPDNLPSLRGWFSALSINRLNFAFYAFTEPKEAINGPALAELQAILDSVEFDLSLLPTPAPTTLPVTIVPITLTPVPATATEQVVVTPTARVIFATATPAP
jgi:hypothetical protein